MSEFNVSTSLRDTYDAYYEEGESAWRRLGAVDKANNIVSLCADLPAQRVLEVGAGEGSVLQRLSELNFGAALYAIELSHSGVEVINRRNIPRLAECLQFDGYTIPYPDASFDIVIISHVLEHVEHPRQLLHEAARVGKYLYIEVPLLDMSRAPHDFVPDAVGHINFYSPRTLRWLLQTCDLRVIRQVTTNPSKAAYTFHGNRTGGLNFLIKEMLLRVAPSFATRHFAYHESVLCTSQERK